MAVCGVVAGGTEVAAEPEAVAEPPEIGVVNRNPDIRLLQ